VLSRGKLRRCIDIEEDEARGFIVKTMGNRSSVKKNYTSR
jgi:hypothetical protein